MPGQRLLDLARALEDSYRQYLATTFYFRDPEFRQSFTTALAAGNVMKGPYIEATPVFQRTSSLTQLVTEVTDIRLDKGFRSAIEADRPLYRHQELAIRRLLAGENVVVATGTASGKTEAFLFPILLHLYREFLSESLRPGVRALILYPMNALANDQRERLGVISRRLVEAGPGFRFTYGQYVGDTPEDAQDTFRHARDVLRAAEGSGYRNSGKAGLTGELVFRAEMRETPPHILLTNYSMLEYLLLRPADSPLFDEGNARSWSFFVLDEAHQYRGSRGIEMAMLVRRLKERLSAGGMPRPPRCIATSATLVGKDRDSTGAANFASRLFDEPFGTTGIIFSEPAPPPKPSQTIRLEASDYAQLLAAAESPERALQEIGDFARRYALASDSLPAGRLLGLILRSDERANQLQTSLSDGRAVAVDVASSELFPELDARDSLVALGNLVQLIVMAEEPETGSPLMACRYHIFLRSLEGAFVSYLPKKAVQLTRGESDGIASFEVALCRECGQHYLVGRKGAKLRKLEEPVRDPSHPEFGVSFFRPVEMEAAVDQLFENQATYELCVRCGQISIDGVGCGHDSSIRVVREAAPADEERADQMKECGVCGYAAGGRDPVKEVVHGADGPNAVIATTLLQELPKDRRKILAFADGRQDAAFFAWYLESSYESVLARSLLYRALKGLRQIAPTGASLAELARALADLSKAEGLVRASAGQIETMRHAWTLVYREFLTDEPRISLEGVGLARWRVEWPAWCSVPKRFRDAPWALSDAEFFDLLLSLVETLRLTHAVALVGEPSIALDWKDLDIVATPIAYRVGQPRSNSKIRSWDGPSGQRVQVLRRILISRGLSQERALDEAVGALRTIWDELREWDDLAPKPDERLLLSAGDAKQLNPSWWRLELAGETVQRCDVCGRVIGNPTLGACTRYRCKGFVKPTLAESLEGNHYRQLYLRHLPPAPRVEEHTAQLDPEKAREFQRDFRLGRINVLSSSTTFELGVDLGDLDVVFLRNVPPEPFNYAQRVGRAGRRGGRPGFAVTYCRRAPHDLYHYIRPERVIAGDVRPPQLRITNAKIVRRHMAAVLLAEFFRANPGRFSNVAAFTGDLNNPSAHQQLSVFAVAERPRLERVLTRIVPEVLHAAVGLIDGSWITQLCGRGGDGPQHTADESRLSDAEAELMDDYSRARQFMDERISVQDFMSADWARRRAQTLEAEDVLSFLSRKAVIPKYGFPVDVVELDTHRSRGDTFGSEVRLERDLAIGIAEFAPTSGLIANKRLWTSYGLKRLAERAWERRSYKRCTRHNVFLYWARGEPQPEDPCGHKLMNYEYVVPQFGFVTKREAPRQPTARPPRLFGTRPYFVRAEGSDPGVVRIPAEATRVSVRRASPGRLIVLSEGRRGEGFYICELCGAGFRKRVREHRTAFGSPCSGTLHQLSLAHEFVTDVIQLEFHNEPDLSGTSATPFALSLAYALAEGAAAVLEVPTNDLNAVVRGGLGGAVPPIVLYDNVPGGAGLVAGLESATILRRCIEAARDRVRGECGCSEVASCYGCLRSYRNQYAHQDLQRGPVLRYLEQLLSGWG